MPLLSASLCRSCQLPYAAPVSFLMPLLSAPFCRSCQPLTPLLSAPLCRSCQLPYAAPVSSLMPILSTPYEDPVNPLCHSCQLPFAASLSPSLRRPCKPAFVAHFIPYIAASVSPFTVYTVHPFIDRPNSALFISCMLPCLQYWTPLSGLLCCPFSSLHTTPVNLYMQPLTAT